MFEISHEGNDHEEAVGVKTSLALTGLHNVQLNLHHISILQQISPSVPVLDYCKT
jgi:hypothetical protein